MRRLWVPRRPWPSQSATDPLSSHHSHPRRKKSRRPFQGFPETFGLPEALRDCPDVVETRPESSGRPRDQVAEHVRHPHRAVPAPVRVQGLGQFLVHLGLVGGPDRRVEQPRSTAAPGPRCPRWRTRRGRPRVRSRPASGRPAGRPPPGRPAAPGANCPRRAADRRASWPPAARPTWRSVPAGPSRRGPRGCRAPRAGSPRRAVHRAPRSPRPDSRSARRRSPGCTRRHRGRGRVLGGRRRRAGAARARGAPCLRLQPLPREGRRSRGDAESTPVTAAPLEAAISRASPEPQPRPSSRVPVPDFQPLVDGLVERYQHPLLDLGPVTRACTQVHAGSSAPREAGAAARA